MTKDCYIKDFFQVHGEKIERHESDCWVWIAAKTGFGHGAVSTGVRNTMAHRSAYEARHGEGTARGRMVLHSCHNPACVNPNHLSLGDHDENMRQMREAGRSVVGEKQPAAKLNDEKVMAIRRRVGAGETLCALAKEYAVTHQVVKKAAVGQTWSHLPGAVKPRNIRMAKGAATVLSKESAAAIRAAVRSGSRRADLAQSYGVSLPTINAIMTGRIWKEAA